jgi:hypothetical protein
MRTLMTRDEREATIDRAGDRVAYVVLSYGLLAIVAYRSFVEGQASWDLLALVVIGGLVSATYRLTHGVLTRQAALLLGLTAAVALIVAVAMRLVVAG